MHVLFLTHDYPFPITNGGQLYTGNVVRELAKSSDQTTAFCFGADCRKESVIKEHGITWHCFPYPNPGVISQLATKYPALCIKNRSEEYRVAVASYLANNRPDVVIINYIAVGWVLEEVQRYMRSAHGKHSRSVYLSHNVETDMRNQMARNFRGSWPAKFAARLDSRKSCMVEKQLVSQTDLTTVITEEDASRFGELFPGRQTLLVQPGYDGEYVQSHEITSSLPKNIAVLGGRLSTMKQIVLDSFLECAAAGLVEKGISTHIMGPMSDSYLAKCHKAYPEIQFHGFVKDIGPLLKTMRLGVVADHVGGGFKLRILTYIFHRIPMIAIPSAMAGLPLKPGRDYIAIDNYQDVPAVCNRVLDDFERLNRLQESAYNQSVDLFSWTRTGEDFANALRQIAEGAPV